MSYILEWADDDETVRQYWNASECRWSGNEKDATVYRTASECHELCNRMKFHENVHVIVIEEKKTRKVSHKELMEWADVRDIVVYPFTGDWYVATIGNDGTLDQIKSEEGCIWSSTPWKAIIAARKVLGR